MFIIRTIRLLITFYSSFAFASLLVSSSCAFLFWKYGYSILPGLFWFKIITMAVIWFFINEYKQRQYYYYHNLGLSKKQLWVAVFLFDFALFILSLITAHYLK